MTINGGSSGSTQERTVRLAFVGDICLAGDFEQALTEWRTKSQSGCLPGIFENVDVAVGNLECCIVQNPVGDLPKSRMIVPRTMTPSLAQFGLDVLSLANNHVLDAGPGGIASTTHELDRIGIRHFGAGRNIDAAEAAALVEINGTRVAFLGACDVPLCFAGHGRAGIAPIKWSRLMHRVRAASIQADFVIVALHADLEFSRFPSPSRVRLSRALIDHGARLVIQHHPHVAQGIERYRDGLIAYSLGNFVFPVATNPYMGPGTDWGVVLYVDVFLRGDQKQLAWRVEPITIGKNNLPSTSEGAHRQQQLRLMEEMSTGLSDRKLIRREWLKRCVAEARSTYYVLSHARRKRGLVEAIFQGIRFLANPYERRWMCGLLSRGHLG